TPRGRCCELPAPPPKEARRCRRQWRAAPSRSFIPALARRHHAAIAALAQEIDDHLRRPVAGELACHRFGALLQRPRLAKQRLVGPPHALDVLQRETALLHADDIDAAEPAAIADSDAKRDQIVGDAGEAAEKSVRADAHELMRRRAAAKAGE